tara:strand:- start:3503 stop:4762 length:1260 start_codon:yes stop_codon:yes gene_type:complete
MKNLRIGICGVGNVGSALLTILKENQSILLKQGNVMIEVLQVGARKGQEAIAYKDINVTKDLFEVASNPEIDVFVELIGGTDLAKELCLTALSNGKHVVTANKAMLAMHGDSLFKIASKKNLDIGFEASVAGGTPVIKALREGLVANQVEWFAGILNGTSNFILSEMSESQTSFNNALKEAQKLGLAEADPTLDIDGTDAAQKASILASLAFNVSNDFSKVSYEGIDKVEIEDLYYAEELGYSVKHIAYGRILEGSASVSAFPTLVSNDHILSQVSQQMNALEIFSKGVGSTVYYGPGAGPLPTASAVVADLVDISKGRRLINVVNKTGKLKKDITQRFSRYFSFKAKNEPGVITKISSEFAKKSVSIEALIQHESKKDQVPLVILTGKIDDKKANSITKNLDSMKDVSSKVRQMRIHS